MSSKIFLHIGLPKTGTTALQQNFYENTESLISQGVLYPSTGLDTQKSYGPNHQRLVNLLFAKNKEGILNYQNEIEIEGIKNSCESIFLSHEGMTNHFYDFEDFFCDWLHSLTNKLELTVLLSIRPIKEFFYAYYKQNIINPPINRDLGFGSDLAPSEFFKLRRIQMILNYMNILQSIKNIHPDLNIKILNTQSQSISRSMTELLGINSFTQSETKHNISLSDFTVEKIRAANKGFLTASLERKTFIQEARKDELYQSSLFSFQEDEELNSKLKQLEMSQMSKLKKEFTFIK